MPNTPKPELSPPQQRRLLRRKEEDENMIRKIAVLESQITKKEQALERWAKKVEKT